MPRREVFGWIGRCEGFARVRLRACLVGNEMRILPSSVAYGAKLLAVFFPLEGEDLQ